MNNHFLNGFQDHVVSKNRSNYEPSAISFLYLLKNELKVILLEEENIIDNLFFGESKSWYYCNRCSSSEEFSNRFVVIKLDFSKNSIKNLLCKEILSKWYCNNCSSRNASLEKSIQKLPQILVIQLIQNLCLNSKCEIPMNINESNGKYFLKSIINSKIN